MEWLFKILFTWFYVKCLELELSHNQKYFLITSLNNIDSISSEALTHSTTKYLKRLLKTNNKLIVTNNLFVMKCLLLFKLDIINYKIFYAKHTNVIFGNDSQYYACYRINGKRTESLCTNGLRNYFNTTPKKIYFTILK